VSTATIVMGHSIGGGCSVLSASGNSQFAAVVNFAAAETTPSAINAAGDVTIPALILSAENDNIAPPSSHQIPVYQNLNSQFKSFVSLLGESHLGITSNTIAFEIIIPFLNHVISGDLSYLWDFEVILNFYSGQGNIEYEIINNLSAGDSYQEKPEYLLESYPNPFYLSGNYIGRSENNVMTIRLQHKMGFQEDTEISIFNIKGELIRKLKPQFNEEEYLANWNGKDKVGNQMASGVYLLHFVAGGRILASRKCLLLK